MIDQRLDLVVLVADGDIKEVILGLLEERQKSLGIKLTTWQVDVHTQHDPGVLRDAVKLLRLQKRSARHALAVLDHEGCGRETAEPEALEQQLTSALAESGWEQRAAAIVIDPEVEQWVWSDSLHVGQALGWPTTAALRDWLASQGQWPPTDLKPPRPKEALDRALREVRMRRSASIFRELAERVGLNRCEDRSFSQLVAVLQGWFAAGAAASGSDAPHG